MSVLALLILYCITWGLSFTFGYYSVREELGFFKKRGLSPKDISKKSKEDFEDLRNYKHNSDTCDKRS